MKGEQASLRSSPISLVRNNPIVGYLFTKEVKKEKESESSPLIITIMFIWSKTIPTVYKSHSFLFFNSRNTLSFMSR